MKSSKYAYHLLATLVLSSSLMISGCSKEEAKALKDTANLFGNESIAAIDATETMILKELQEPTQTEEEEKALFLRVVLRQQISDEDLVSNLKRLMNPPQPSATAVGNLKAYMASLREQYGTLVAIYDDVERGHLLANEAVQKSKAPLEKLTVQMAYLAVCVDKYPANLLKDQSKVLAEIRRLRNTYFKTADPATKKDIEGKIVEQFFQWQKIEKNEQELTQNVLNPATKAAMLGRELREKIDRYGDITLESLNSLLINVLDIVSNVNGQDYSGLKKQANQVWEAIKNDEDFRGSAEVILSQFNSNLRSGGSGETAFSVNGCAALIQMPNPAPNSTPSGRILPNK
jgi:hypothetical protein